MSEGARTHANTQTQARTPKINHIHTHTKKTLLRIEHTRGAYVAHVAWGERMGGERGWGEEVRGGGGDKRVVGEVRGDWGR